MTANKIFACIILLLNINFAYPQKNLTLPQQKKSKDGNWEITAFPAGIIKVAFVPLNDKKHEQVSNAVIQQAVKTMSSDVWMTAEDNNSSLSFSFAAKKIL